MAETTDTNLVDHVKEARDWVENACVEYDEGRSERGDRDLQLAQAHAQIATAEALGGIWHELEELNVRLSR